MSEPLPPNVRAQVVAFAADTLADLAEQDVPAPLIAVRRFIPSRRARLGATPLAAAIANDTVFRGRVAERVRLALPDLVAALSSAEGPPEAAPPEEIAAVAYVLRLPGWERMVEAAAQELAEAAAAALAAQAAGTAARLSDQLEALKRSSRVESDQLRDRLAVARTEVEDARRRLRSSADRIRRAELDAQDAVQAAERIRDEAVTAAREAETESRRLRQRVTELEAALAAARRGSREARSVEDVRLRVLLDTLMAAANGFRKELSLPTAVRRPADVAGREDDDAILFDPFCGVGARGLAEDDPGVVDEVLAIPGVHLIVDGYNVTKRGYGSLTLQAQRARLLSGLGALVGRAPESEITVVFDATAVIARPVGVTAPRGVRVVFSRSGQLADEEIIRLVRAEPAGRPVAVVTSDREVAETSRMSGARPIPSAALLTRLDRS
ncbi:MULTISPECIES: NYN domain-containing protein [unclassified Frankia]|uniref:NYN domain-containing protein n=1 Tax=unclassified Frankia TaxID=2632575 RepID=UPI002AD2B13C|nr:MULTISPECIES: NYN domain-containing protein [unclassified Frankia]